MTPDERGAAPIEEYKGAWRAEVAGRIRDVEARLAVVGEREDPLGRRRLAAIRRSLADARAAIDNHRMRRRIRVWWTGSAITAAWEAVQSAEGELAYLESDERVRASLPALLAWIKRVMRKGGLRDHYERLLESYVDAGEPSGGRRWPWSPSPAPSSPNRDVVRQAYRDAIVANTDRYGNIHVFRRLLALVIALLSLAVVALSVWHAIDPTVVPIYADGPGEDVADSLDVAAVAVVGAIGGLLAIAFGLGERQAVASRYDPRTWQASLKAVAGAATAIVGVLLVQSDLVVAPTGTGTPALLAYAALFGFSQQAFTRFVDKRAEALVAPEDGEQAASAEAKPAT